MNAVFIDLCYLVLLNIVIILNILCGQEDMKDFAANSHHSVAGSPGGADGTQCSSASDTEAPAPSAEKLIREVKNKLDGRIEKLSYQLEESVKRQMVLTERQQTENVERHEDITQTLRDLMLNIGEMKKELADMKTHSVNRDRKGGVAVKPVRRGKSAKVHLTTASPEASSPVGEALKRYGVIEHIDGPPLAMIVDSRCTTEPEVRNELS